MNAQRMRGQLACWAVLVFLSAICLPKAAAQSYSHINTWQNIYTATTGDLPFIREHYDFVKLYPDLIGPYRDSGGTGLLWVYSQYHCITIERDYDFIRQWCADNGADQEAMWTHFAEDTVYRPDYESATSDGSTEQRFDTVWVYNGSAYVDRTANAYAGDAFQIGQSVGWVLYIGYQERFKEVNVGLATAASGWTGVWEYWNGSAWTNLGPTDGTSGMTKSGKVEFMPPPQDWARRAVNGKERWWVRLTTLSAGGTSPVVAGGGLQGRSFIVPTAGRYRQPGWDSSNDTNSDGCWDTNVNPNATALFPYEARVHLWQLEHTYLNLDNPDTRVAYPLLAKQLVETPISGTAYTYDCLFLDVVTDRIVISNLSSGGSTIEDTSNATWQDNTVLMIRAVKQAVGPTKIVKLNTGPYIGGAYELFIDEADAWHGEGFLTTSRPYGIAQIDAVLSRDARGKYSMIHAQGKGGYDDLERQRVYSLATFYLTHGQRTYYQFRRDVLPDQRFIDNWYAAIEYDIGQPLDPYYILHQEDDPSCPHDSYGIARVYAREFERALVVSCPLPHWDSAFTPSYSVALPSYEVGGAATSNRYRILHSDGSLDENVIDSISLRNSDGAILIKADLNPPDLSLRKVSESSEAVPGGTVTYTIFYENTSATEILFNVTLLDPVPSGTTYDAAFGTYHNQEVEPLDPDPYSDGKIIVALGNLVPGESGWVKFRVIVGSAP